MAVEVAVGTAAQRHRLAELFAPHEVVGSIRLAAAVVVTGQVRDERHAGRPVEHVPRSELPFDSGVGELFVIRVANNVVDRAGVPVKDSIEYAVAELNVPLVVVMLPSVDHVLIKSERDIASTDQRFYDSHQFLTL